MSETNWNDLARRCEEATGADREIDERIMILACDIGDPTAPWPGCPRHYTRSLDAITALIERELGGCGWTIDRPMDAMSDFKPIGGITLDYRETPEGPECEHYSGQAATPALALCAAFCKAMAHRSTPHE